MLDINSSIVKKKMTIVTNCTPLITEDQNGFRKGRSCTDGYFILKLILEKRKFNLELHTAFIDYEKAFDKLNREKLLFILK